MTKVERINPKDQGRRQLSLEKPLFDADALDRADEVLEEMAESFQEWLLQEMERLQNARLDGERLNWHGKTLETLHLSAHDLKGLGGTYGYPLVTQLAGSLCKLIEMDKTRAKALSEPGLIGAHVDALRAAARDKIQTEEHPVGGALLRALRERVALVAGGPLSGKV